MQQVMHEFICNFLPKVGLDQLSRWFRFGGDPVDLHCQFRIYSCPARWFRHTIDCSAETSKITKNTNQV